jgi:hypothetical protein
MVRLYIVSIHIIYLHECLLLDFIIDIFLFSHHSFDGDRKFIMVLPNDFHFDFLGDCVHSRILLLLGLLVYLISLHLVKNSTKRKVVIGR